MKKHDFFGIDYNYLRHEIGALKPREKPFRDEEGDRQFYYNTEYSPEEAEKISEYEKKLAKKQTCLKMPPGWTKDDSLRMVCTSDLNIDTAIQKTEAQIQWFTS